MSRHGASFDLAQAAYDARMPDDDDANPCASTCATCDGEGIIAVLGGHLPCPECNGEGVTYKHRWRFSGEAPDGTRFCRCFRCGMEEKV